MSSKIPVWLDCDPGNDDALAIILSVYNPKIKLIGISTCKGNVSAERCTINACNILWACGASNINVIQGSCGPINEGEIASFEINAEEIHGILGIGTEMFEGGKFEPVREEALLHIAEKIMESECKVTLLATGPLTNFAMLFEKFPEVKDNVERLVLMGGALTTGNITNHAEYNIFVDPEAADIVFSHTLEIIMVPLEVTMTAIFHQQYKEELKVYDSKFIEACLELIEYYSKAYNEIYGLESCPVHDPCAVAFCIAPEIFEVMECNVEIIIEGEMRGKTVCDIEGLSGKMKNLKVAKRMDLDKFWEMMIAALGEASINSRIEVKMDE